MPRPQRFPRTALLAALLLCGTACGSHGGASDAGPAPHVTPPAAPRAVWPDRKPPSAYGAKAFTGDPQDTAPAPLHIDGVPDDIHALDIGAVLRADPDNNDEIRPRPDGTCPGCTVWPTAFHDLTGEGVPEALVTVQYEDNNAALIVYRLYEGAVYRIYDYGGSDYTVETAGTDLVISQRLFEDGDPTCCANRTDTHRARWNGTRLAVTETRTEQKPRTAEPQVKATRNP